MWVILPVIALLMSVMLIFPPSRGNAKPFHGEGGASPNESIYEKIWVDINGFQQGMFLKGKDITNPVLLF